MSRQSISSACLRLALPKGRMEQAVLTLLGDAGIRIRPSARGYRSEVSLPDTEAKTLKPQNIVEMLSLGSRDLGFAGADWVAPVKVSCPVTTDWSWHLPTNCVPFVMGL